MSNLHKSSLHHGVTFQVNDLEIPKKRLPIVANYPQYHDVDENFLFGFSSPETIEAHSKFSFLPVDVVSDNYFIQAVHCAFADHYPLSLSPDHIWLLLCQGFANHISIDPELLRERLVKHDGKIKIEVVRNDLIKGSPDNDWESVFPQFIEAMKAYANPELFQIFRADFSTSGSLESAVMQLTLMHALKHYFDYVISQCGIPSITLEGTPEDWIEIRKRVEAFRKYGLHWWVDELAPLLDQFVRAANHDIDRAFWQSIYKYKSISGGPFITGWIIKFLPYIGMRKHDSQHVNENTGSMVKNTYFEYGMQEDDIELHKHSIPTGTSKIPFQWDTGTKNYNMIFETGFTAISQDAETGTIRPEIGWFVKEKPD